MMYLAGAITLLKLTLGCTVAGLTVTLLNDPDVHKLYRAIKERKDRKMKQVTHIDLPEAHMTVLGQTQHGKTHLIKNTLNTVKGGGVFFFNTQLEPMPKNFIEASGANSWEQILGALEAGKKINFIPTTDSEKRSKQLETIIKKLYDGQKRDIRFVVDEAHLYKKGALSKMQEIATTGLRFGIKGIWISQRGALLDNTLISQSNFYVFFYLGLTDQKYFREYGFPMEEIQSRINKEKYLFCTYDGKEIEGAYKTV